MTGKCVISKKMETARFWLLWLINIHDHSKVTSLFPSSSIFSPSWFFIFKRSFIHLVLSGNRLVASLPWLPQWRFSELWTAVTLAFIGLSTWNLQRPFKTSLSTLCENFVKQYVNLKFWWCHCKSRMSEENKSGAVFQNKKRSSKKQ